MDDIKLKNSFSKIRKDMDFLNEKVYNLIKELDKQKSQLSLNFEIKSDLEKLKKVDFEKFTSNLELEFKSINQFLKEFQERFNQSSKDFNDFSKSMISYKKELEEIKLNLKENDLKTDTNKQVLILINKQIKKHEEENKGLINDVISKKINPLKMEMYQFQEGFEDIKSSLEKSSMPHDLLDDFKKIMHEKIEYERKLIIDKQNKDFSRMYDQFFAEISKLKSDLGKDSSSNNQPRSIKKLKN